MIITGHLIPHSQISGKVKLIYSGIVKIL
jgi:hypothetical protein